MADSYYGYSSTADAGSVARSSFPGYFPSEVPSLASYPTLNPSVVQRIPSDYSQIDINPIQHGPYGYSNIASAGVFSDPVISSSNPEPYRYTDSSSIVAHPETVISGVTTGAASIKGYTSPMEDPNLVTQRWDTNSVGISLNLVNERPSSVRNVGGTPVRTGESNLLFVDELPRDCTRREVGHLFRPFIGFKDIRLVHKEPRHSGDKALVLCFVEFTDSKCALTAMEALQGYKFDDKKLESPTLKIQFAHFPFRLPSNST